MKAIVLLSAFVSLPAFAGSSSMDFADILDACQNPARYHNQIAPSNIQITCEERATSWVANPVREMALPLMRQISTSLTSDKYSVAPQVHQLAVEDQAASCPAFKEVIEVTSFTKATTCDELLGVKGGVQEFCSDILGKAKDANPKMVSLNDTGRVVEFCSQGYSNQGKGQQGKGEQGKGQQGKGQQGKGQGQGQGQRR